jgi:type II secretory ATPase GspE/PulE/Tfp pilus assembly ATPase PilB-like protein
MYEVMTMSDPVKELVLQGGLGRRVEGRGHPAGMRTLRMSGIKKICQGTSSVRRGRRVSRRRIEETHVGRTPFPRQ